MQDNEKFQVISTKVSPESYMLLTMLCKKRGLSPYEFLQMVIDTLIRYMDSRHNLTKEMEQAMSLFDHMEGWPTLNIADPTSDKAVHEATYYFTEEKQRGVRALHVETPFMGERIATYNVQEILEKTICLLLPDRYRRLRLIAEEHGQMSLLQCIDELIIEAEKESNTEEYRRMFGDNDRSSWGIKPSDAPYKQKKKRGFDNERDRKMLEGDLFGSAEEDNNDELKEYEEEEEEYAQQGICETDELQTMEDAQAGETDE